MINSTTKQNLLFGVGVEKSIVPELHNSIYKLIGTQDEYCFGASEIKQNDLQNAVQAIKILGINGIIVGDPYKGEIIRCLDDVDEPATIIGGVNTVVNKNGMLKGFNTEWLGALMPLADTMKVEIKRIGHIPKFLSDKKVGIIGVGKAARAIAYATLIAGADLLISTFIVSANGIKAPNHSVLKPLSIPFLLTTVLTPPINVAGSSTSSRYLIISPLYGSPTIIPLIPRILIA